MVSLQGKFAVENKFDYRAVKVTLVLPSLYRDYKVEFMIPWEQIQGGKEFVDYLNSLNPTPKQADRLESQEFYELMQAYRHSPVEDFKRTAETYNAVKTWLRRWWEK